MNKGEITTLFLDIGNVLLSNGWGHDFREQAAEEFKIDTSEMEQRHALFFAVYEEGRITLDEYLDRVIFFRERDFNSGQFKDFIFSLSTADEKMIAFVKALKHQYNLKIVAVSNEGSELNAFRIQKFKLNSFIDFFISSCYVQIRKPDARIFTMALNTSRVTANEVIYIDDVQMFVDVAADLGIKGVCQKDYLSTVNAFEKFGMTIR